nr:hypothetical protein [Tanacetum cinerariifolium]
MYGVLKSEEREINSRAKCGALPMKFGVLTAAVTKLSFNLGMSMGLEPMELEPKPMDPRIKFFLKVGIENRPKNRKISNSRTKTRTGGSGSGLVLLGSGPVPGSDPVL